MNNLYQYLARQKILDSNRYIPQPHQKEWHDNPTRFLVAVCGRQIGKTTAAVNELIKRAWNNPNTRNWYVTNDYKQAKRNVWTEIKNWIPKDTGAKFNESELSIIFPNGSRIELIGVENAESLRGAVVHFMILDEYADFPRHIWPEILSKMMATTEGDVWFIGTPKGMGNDLHDKFFLNNSQYTKYKVPACRIEEGSVVGLTSVYAKKSVIQDDLDTDPTETFNQEYLAEFTRPAGTVYFDWPLENFKEVSYDNNLPLHISMDFGVNDPTSIIWLQPCGGEYRVIDYYEASDANIEHFVSIIQSKPYKQAELYTGDPAGKARTLTTGTSPIEILSTKGIYVRTKDGVKIPNQVRATHGLIKSLFVSNKLTRFRDCLLNYSYPEDKEFEGKRNQENELPIHDEYSHAMRALEYYAVNIKDVGRETKKVSHYRRQYAIR
ncbi:MAG: terminase large subunit domain-containing protein [Candidatus Heimdallarchaeaceae archaeon]